MNETIWVNSKCAGSLWNRHLEPSKLDRMSGNRSHNADTVGKIPSGVQRYRHDGIPTREYNAINAFVIRWLVLHPSQLKRDVSNN